MVYDNRGRMWPKFPDICLTVEGKPQKNLNQEIDPAGDRTRARCMKSNYVFPRLQRWSWTYWGLEFRCRQGAFVVGNVGIFFRVSSGYSSFPNLISSTLSSSRFPAPQFHAIYYSHSIILCHPSPHPWLGNISCVWSTNSILSYLLMGGGRGRDTHHVHLHWT